MVCKCISKYTFEMEAKITINHDYLSHLSHHIWLPHKSCKSLEENKYVFLFTPSLSSFTDMSNISYVFSFRVSALLFAQNGKFGKLGKNVSSFTMDVTQTLDLEFPCIKPGMATNNFLLLTFFLNPDWILINIDISPQDILGGYYSLLLVPNQGCFNWSSWTSNDEIVKIKKIASVTIPGTSGRTIDLKEAVPPRASQFIFMDRLWLWMQTTSMDAKSWMPATLTATSNWASRLNSNPEAKVRLRSIGDPGVTVATGPSEISHPKDKTNSVLPITPY